jgi:hypothetical protein
MLSRGGQLLPGRRRLLQPWRVVHAGDLPHPTRRQELGTVIAAPLAPGGCLPGGYPVTGDDRAGTREPVDEPGRESVNEPGCESVDEPAREPAGVGGSRTGAGNGNGSTTPGNGGATVGNGSTTVRRRQGGLLSSLLRR